MTRRREKQQRWDKERQESQPTRRTVPPKKQLVQIAPRTANQKHYLRKLQNENIDIVFGIGAAGVGKTYLPCLLAVKMLKENAIDKVVVTRPAVSVDEEHGFLPGSLEQKMTPWVRPIFDVFSQYYYAREIEHMIREGVIEIAPLSYMRGRSFERCFIIADEIQNATVSQTKMLLTRIGEGSKMVVTGDLNQHDRGFENNGLSDFVDKLKNSDSKRISVIEFGIEDIQRHPVVAEVLRLYGED